MVALAIVVEFSVCGKWRSKMCLNRTWVKARGGNEAGHVAREVKDRLGYWSY